MFENDSIGRRVSRRPLTRRPLPSPPTSEDRKLIASNRKARHDYSILDTIETGIVLQVITATRDYTGGSLGYTPDRTRGSHLLALQFDDKVTWYLIALAVWAAWLGGVARSNHLDT